MTGDIVNAVRNSDRLISTAFGGVSGIPKAWRTIDKTITVRTKLVMHMTTVGTRASTVRRTAVRTRSGLLLGSGNGSAVGWAAWMRMARTLIRSPTLFGIRGDGSLV